MIGVFVFQWSALETIAALLLDALSTLWMMAGVDAYVVVRDPAQPRTPGLVAVLRFAVGLVLTFLFMAALLSLFVIVPSFFVLSLAHNAGLDVRALLTSGWLQRAFAAMLACQLPGLAGRVRAAAAGGAAAEQKSLGIELEFLAHRTIVIGMIATMLAIFGPYGIQVLVLVAQVFGAGSEIMRDRYVAYVTEMRT